MSYWLLNLLFLAAIGVAYIIRKPQVNWRKFGVQLGVMLLLTAIFDNLIIHFNIVIYDRDLISGWLIYKAPLEDFAYTLAACLLIPLLWDGSKDGQT